MHKYIHFKTFHRLICYINGTQSPAPGMTEVNQVILQFHKLIVTQKRIQPPSVYRHVGRATSGIEYLETAMPMFAVKELGIYRVDYTNKQADYLHCSHAWFCFRLQAVPVTSEWWTISKQKLFLKRNRRPVCAQGLNEEFSSLWASIVTIHPCLLELNSGIPTLVLMLTTLT